MRYQWWTVKKLLLFKKDCKHKKSPIKMQTKECPIDWESKHSFVLYTLDYFLFDMGFRQILLLCIWFCYSVLVGGKQDSLVEKID